MYRRSVIEHYDDHADIVIRDRSDFKDDVERILPYIANAFVQHNEGSVRTDGATRTKGTISVWPASVRSTTAGAAMWLRL